MDKISETIETLKQYGQEHIVRLLKKLDEENKQELIEQIGHIDFHQMM